MKINITGRHMEISPALKEYVEKRLDKVEKYFHQLIEIQIIMNVEKLEHVVEILVNGDGVQFFAMEKSGDLYSSVDLIVDKIEKQIVRFKEKQSGHKVVSLRMIDTIDIMNREGVELSFNQASNKPKTVVEAYLEMKLLDSDFILFKKGVQDIKGGDDYSNRNYAVIYRDDTDMRIVEIPFNMIKSNSYDPEAFVESKMTVVKDSKTDPKIKLSKNSSTGNITKCTTADAVKLLMDTDKKFIPFFNEETNSLNVVFNDGRNYSVMVPAF